MLDRIQNITVRAHVIERGKSHDATEYSFSTSPSPAFALPCITNSNSNPPQSRTSSRQILLPLPSHRLKRSSVVSPALSRDIPPRLSSSSSCACADKPYKTTFSCFFLSLPTSYSKPALFSFSLLSNQVFWIFSVCESRISSFCACCSSKSIAMSSAQLRTARRLGQIASHVSPARQFSTSSAMRKEIQDAYILSAARTATGKVRTSIP